MVIPYEAEPQEKAPEVVLLILAFRRFGSYPLLIDGHAAECFDELLVMLYFICITLKRKPGKAYGLFFEVQRQLISTDGLLN